MFFEVSDLLRSSSSFNIIVTHLETTGSAVCSPAPTDIFPLGFMSQMLYYSMLDLAYRSGRAW